MQSPSTASSASANGKMECPFCHVPLVRIQSKQPATKDVWFFKCPYNIKGDPTTCGYIRPEAQVAVHHGVLKTMEASVESSVEMKEELQELKQIVESVVLDLWKLKKVKTGEVKPEGETKNWQIVLDCSSQATVAFFVGVFISLVVVGLWK